MVAFSAKSGMKATIGAIFGTMATIRFYGSRWVRVAITASTAVSR